MPVISKNAEAWTADKVSEPAIPPAWPHEVMIKLFSSRSHSDISARFLDLQGADVLDRGRSLRLSCFRPVATPDDQAIRQRAVYRDDGIQMGRLSAAAKADKAVKQPCRSRAAG